MDQYMEIAGAASGGACAAGYTLSQHQEVHQAPTHHL
jgi:hypothetical protein